MTSSGRSGAWVAASCTILLALPFGTVVARATTVTVPDDVPTIQSALATGVDTVFIRPGVYDETPTIQSPVWLLGSTGDTPTRVSGLHITPLPTDVYSEVFGFDHLTFDTTVVTHNDDERCSVLFSNCVFSHGIDDQSTYVTTSVVGITHCTINGLAGIVVDGP